MKTYIIWMLAEYGAKYLSDCRLTKYEVEDSLRNLKNEFPGKTFIVEEEGK